MQRPDQFGNPQGPGSFAPPTDPIVQTPGTYKLAYLVLSSPDFGVTLSIKIIIRTMFNAPDPGIYRVYYLSPLDVSDAIVALDFTTAKLSRQMVADLSSDGVALYTSVPMTPPGTDGGRRDYSLGGWMYAEPLPNSGADFNYGSSNLVRVPTFDKNTVPADKALTSISGSVTGTVGGEYTVTLKVVNPAPVFGRTQYVQILMYNYKGDASYRWMGTYRLHGAPGDPNGQQIVYSLEAEGGHPITFYAAHANGQRAIPFGKVFSTYPSTSFPGGFP